MDAVNSGGGAGQGPKIYKGWDRVEQVMHQVGVEMDLANMALIGTDKDHDGAYSRQELGMAQDRFDRMDANHDGKLTPEEYRNGRNAEFVPTSELMRKVKEAQERNR